MTNHSYKVTLDSGEELLVRIPGEGTEEMINRLIIGRIKDLLHTEYNKLDHEIKYEVGAASFYSDNELTQASHNILTIITQIMECYVDDISNVEIMKKGMTNRSFSFRVNRGPNIGKYIIRIPGEGTDKLINREHEAKVFSAIKGLGLCDDPVYLDPRNGIKITRFLEGVRTCDVNNFSDLRRCMDKLRAFHRRHLYVPHVFDIYAQIDYYESLWEGKPSVYGDYRETKENVFQLKQFIDGIDKEFCLTHIDAVPDNFLFYNEGGVETLQLTDWEYSGMQDPHLDIAMFCIYSLYNREQIDRLINIYFDNSCDQITRAKIYGYIATGGLLWSNWCEYKRNLGVEFGEYSLRQYLYAKEYSELTHSEMEVIYS